MAEDKFLVGSVDIAVDEALNKLGNLKQTAKETKNDIEKGAEFKVDVDDSKLDKAKKKIGDLSKETEKQSKKISQQIKKAMQASSEEEIISSKDKRSKKLNDYKGQTSDYLENAKAWSKEIEESQSRLNKLVHSNAPFKEIESELNNLISATEEFNSSMSVVESTMEKSISTKSLEEAKQNIEDIKNSFKDILSDSQLKNLNDFQSKYVEGLTSSGKTSLDNQVSEIKKQVQEQVKALEEVAKIRKEVESGIFDVRSAKIDNTLSKYTGQSSEAIVKLRADAEAVKNAQKELTNSLNAENVDTDKVQANYAQLSSALEKYGNSLKVVKEIETTTLRDGEALNASNKVQTYINNNTKALKKYGTELNNIKEAYKGVQTVGEKNNLDAQFKNLKMKISAEGLSGMSRFDDIKRAFSQISQFAGIYGIAQNLIQDVPRQIISAVTEVNAAQIELTKVSDASGSQLSQYWDQAADSAKKYGATISDVISSTADWSKLGYGLDQAKTLSDVTTLYQKVGDNMTQETASQSLVSTLQGFNMQADEAVSIVDKFNEVKIKAASIFSNEYALCA